MNVAVLTGDPLFRSAATGVIGALGHALVTDAAAGDCVVCDVATVAWGEIAATLDPFRTILFLPAAGGGAMSAGFVHTAPRTALPVQLPELLALLDS